MIGLLCMLSWLTAGVTAPSAVATPSATLGGFSFSGAGDGHGVGMSQWGARGYAVNGWSAESILRHYYTGSATARFTSGPLRVWLADVGTQTTFSTSGAIPVTADSNPGGVTVNSAAGQLSITRDGAGLLSLTQAGQPLITSVVGPVVVRVGQAPPSTCSSAGSPLVNLPCVQLAATGRSYGFGSLEFSATASGIRVVERDLSAQQYLYGLAEVPSSWPAEALKAQVVAARSYALHKQLVSGDNRADCSCTVRGTPADQAFGGLSKLAEGSYGPVWQSAVDITAGIVISADGTTPLLALYSASSGGRTESNEDAFGGSPLSYLRSVPDPGDLVPGNPWAAWGFSIPAASMQAYLDADSRTAVGNLSGLEVNGPFTAAGRPEQVRIIGSARTVSVPVWTFTSVINASAPSSQSFPSTLFSLSREPFARSVTGGAFVAAGADAVSPLTVIGSGAGSASEVRVVRSDGSSAGDFSPYSSFGGGVRVAFCIDPTGRPLILTAPGPGGSSDIRLYSLTGMLVAKFQAFPDFYGGAFVACGRVGPGGTDRLVVSADAGGGPAVRTFTFAGVQTGAFYAYDAGFGGGVRVAVGALIANGRQQIVTGTGAGGGNVVQVVDGVETADQRVIPNSRFVASTSGDGVYVGALSDAPLGAVIIGSGDGPHAAEVEVRRLDGTRLLSKQVFANGLWGGGARVSWSPELGVVAGTGSNSWPNVRLVP